MLTTAEIVAARFARSSVISAARPGDRQGRPPAEIIELHPFSGLTP